MKEINGNVFTLNGKQYDAQELVGMEVIFPMSRSDFDDAVGITVTVLAGTEAKEAAARGDAKGMFEVVLDTDALAPIGLQKGAVLPVEMRGASAPVVPWGFAKKYR